MHLLIEQLHSLIDDGATEAEIREAVERVLRERAVDLERNLKQYKRDGAAFRHAIGRGEGMGDLTKNQATALALAMFKGGAVNSQQIPGAVGGALVKKGYMTRTVPDYGYMVYAITESGQSALRDWAADAQPAGTDTASGDAGMDADTDMPNVAEVRHADSIEAQTAREALRAEFERSQGRAWENIPEWDYIWWLENQLLAARKAAPDAD